MMEGPRASKDTDAIIDLSDSYLPGEESKMDVDEGLWTVEGVIEEVLI